MYTISFILSAVLLLLSLLVHSFGLLILTIFLIILTVVSKKKAKTSKDTCQSIAISPFNNKSSIPLMPNTSVNMIPKNSEPCPNTKLQTSDAHTPDTKIIAQNADCSSPSPDKNVQEEETLLALHRDLLSKMQQFNDTLSSIPSADIHLAETFDPKYKNPQDLEFVHSRITAKSDINKLGTFVVIDSETTSLQTATCGVIEVSAIRFVNFVPTQIFTTLIRPNRAIPSKITEITGITNDMVKDSPCIQQVIPALNDFCSGYNLVGHNLDFDLSVLEKYGFHVFENKRKFYDTLAISRKILKTPKRKWDKDICDYVEDDECFYHVENHKLDTLCTYYSIFRDTSHRSASDCLATGLLFKKLVGEILNA